jgi:ribosomal protein S18 acetylase RimI-like enzyme
MILEEEALGMRDAAFFAERFMDDWERIAVAAEGERLLGFSQVTDGHIDMLFVDPAHARSGVGAALLAEAERNGASSLECFRDNAVARIFYERHGWHMAEEYARPFLGRDRAFVLYRKSSDGQPR